MSARGRRQVLRDVDLMLRLGALKSCETIVDSKGTNRLSVVLPSGTRATWTARQLELYALGVRTGRRITKDREGAS